MHIAVCHYGRPGEAVNNVGVVLGSMVMGTAKKKDGKEMVSVETDLLRDRLNKLYQNRRSQGHRLDMPGASEGLFEYLWDLKEKALMDRRAKVDVPRNWLDQLEQEQSDRRH
jgi:hypothetical protein